MGRTKQTPRAPKSEKRQNKKAKNAARLEKKKQGQLADAVTAVLGAAATEVPKPNEVQPSTEVQTPTEEDGDKKRPAEDILEEVEKIQWKIGDQCAKIGKTIKLIKDVIHLGLNYNCIKMAASPDQKLLKDLQIKTNVVKRLVKEYHAYEKEVDKQKERIEKIKSASDVDEYAVKKANEVLQETRSMLPMTASRVKKACVELREFVDKNRVNLESTEQLTHAYEELKSADSID